MHVIPRTVYSAHDTLSLPVLDSSNRPCAAAVITLSYSLSDSPSTSPPPLHPPPPSHQNKQHFLNNIILTASIHPLIHVIEYRGSRTHHPSRNALTVCPQITLSSASTPARSFLPLALSRRLSSSSLPPLPSTPSTPSTLSSILSTTR